MSFADVLRRALNSSILGLLARRATLNVRNPAQRPLLGALALVRSPLSLPSQIDPGWNSATLKVLGAGRLIPGVARERPVFDLKPSFAEEPTSNAAGGHANTVSTAA